MTSRSPSSTDTDVSHFDCLCFTACRISAAESRSSTDFLRCRVGTISRRLCRLPSQKGIDYDSRSHNNHLFVCCVYTHSPSSSTSHHNIHAYTTHLQSSTSIKAYPKPNTRFSKQHCMLRAVIRQATLHTTLPITTRSMHTRVSCT
jgi:hypothetical protein